MDQSLLTVPEAAERLAVSIRHVYDLAGEGKLPHCRVGYALRFPVAALDAWISEQVKASMRPEQSKPTRRPRKRPAPRGPVAV